MLNRCAPYCTPPAKLVKQSSTDTSERICMRLLRYGRQLRPDSAQTRKKLWPNSGRCRWAKVGRHLATYARIWRPEPNTYPKLASGVIAELGLSVFVTSARRMRRRAMRRASVVHVLAEPAARRGSTLCSSFRIRAIRVGVRVLSGEATLARKLASRALVSAAGSPGRIRGRPVLLIAWGACARNSSRAPGSQGLRRWKSERPRRVQLLLRSGGALAHQLVAPRSRCRVAIPSCAWPEAGRGCLFTHTLHPNSPASGRDVSR